MLSPAGTAVAEVDADANAWLLDPDGARLSSYAWLTSSGTRENVLLQPGQVRWFSLRILTAGVNVLPRGQFGTEVQLRHAHLSDNRGVVRMSST